MILYLASSNPGKLREFRQAALAHGLEVEPAPNLETLPEPVEDGPTFAENARKKAEHYSRLVDGLVFADDSGLLVEALGGAPGVHSARFAGPRATDGTNNRKLLKMLRRAEEKNPRDRHARYVAVIVLARRGEILAEVEGSASGEILDKRRGTGGFGYDPYFHYSPLGKTFAELTPEEKFQVSHRGEAFRKLLAKLDELRQSGRI